MLTKLLGLNKTVNLESKKQKEITSKFTNAFSFILNNQLNSLFVAPIVIEEKTKSDIVKKNEKKHNQQRKTKIDRNKDKLLPVNYTSENVNNSVESKDIKEIVNKIIENESNQNTVVKDIEISTNNNSSKTNSRRKKNVKKDEMIVEQSHDDNIQNITKVDTNTQKNQEEIPLVEKNIPVKNYLNDDDDDSTLSELLGKGNIPTNPQLEQLLNDE